MLVGVLVETSITAHPVFVAPDVDVPNRKTGAEEGGCTWIMIF
jgi:hypothetical protein